MKIKFFIWFLVLLVSLLSNHTLAQDQIKQIEIYAIKDSFYYAPIDEQDIKDKGIYVRFKNQEAIGWTDLVSKLANLDENIYFDYEEVIGDIRLILIVLFENERKETYYFTSYLFGGIGHKNKLYIPTYKLYQTVYSFLPKGYSQYENNTEEEFDDVIERNHRKSLHPAIEK